ncbi:Dynein heavy chain 3, axonemal [Echinococcus granulosus]|uniref:Dynein heavy chain 3, axonemal n=1 Tax=Echinococcus granulosus TaxID=6210 RepID=W6UZ59_ECHGR|nr:Dynein heavy chain 3, axonemal [Echinococcus granulosus]EUB58894.1 Dynein heavy chain 3, axonemal [Echinococcus granulosus]
MNFKSACGFLISDCHGLINKRLSRMSYAILVVQLGGNLGAFIWEPDYSSSFTKYLPSLPLPAKPEAPSSLFAIVNKNADHPPLIAQFTLTRAAPFKDQKFHRPPSQSIGSNYSPAAAKLQLDRLPPQSRLPEFAGVSKSKRLKTGENYYL